MENKLPRSKDYGVLGSAYNMRSLAPPKKKISDVSKSKKE